MKGRGGNINKRGDARSQESLRRSVSGYAGVPRAWAKRTENAVATLPRRHVSAGQGHGNVADGDGLNADAVDKKDARAARAVVLDREVVPLCRGAGGEGG